MGQALANLDELTDDERIDLAVALWDSVGEKSAALPLTSEQAHELDRRVAAYKAGGDPGTPWRECIERIANRR
ncbi:MAG: addiction module protein [Acidobacteriota bacterium]